MNSRRDPIWDRNLQGHNITAKGWDFVMAFGMDEFCHRWQRARLSALAGSSSAIAEFLAQTGLALGLSANKREADLLEQLTDSEFDQALTSVFDNSRKLALSASRYLKLQLDIDDFSQLVEAAGIPCALGQWSTRPTARVVEQTGCAYGETRRSRVCDWFREAIDGVVMGLGSTARYVRHRSAAHGDAGCCDVYFDDGESGRDPTLRYGPVPAPMRDALRGTEVAMQQSGHSVQWIGFSAGALFYELHSAGKAPICGKSGRAVHEKMIASVRSVLPDIHIHDAAPLAVYGEGTR
jgi:hypothetical protein